MSDRWARLTRGRAVSTAAHRAAVAAAYREGFDAGELHARISHYASPKIPQSETVDIRTG